MDADELKKESNPLFKFAYVPIAQRLEDLATLAEPEPGDWAYKNTPSDRPRPILYSYLIYTFKRVVEQLDNGTLVFTNDRNGRLAAFDTGLMTPNFEPIIAVFSPNNRGNARQEWFLQCFCRPSDPYARRFEHLPELVTYIDDPADLVFDPNKRVDFRIDHIVQDNIERFPEKLQEMPPHLLRNLVESAANDSLKRVKRNYKIGIPQFYRKRGGEGKIQLLLPLCLMQKERADLALAFDTGEYDYVANTILTLDMAYNNARLLTRPDRYWLDP